VLIDGVPGLSLGTDADLSDDTADCDCRVAFESTGATAGSDDGRTLVLDATDCPDGGDLANASGCRATAVGALAERDATAVHTETDGRVRAYTDDAAAFLLAAGRFVERAAVHDARVAARARSDPLGAAREATGRAGPVARIAAETGLAEGTARASDYGEALPAYVGPTVSETRIAGQPPPEAELLDRRELDTGAVVRRYARRDGVPHYALDPVERRFGVRATALLSAAHEALARGAVDGGERAPGRAVRHVLDRPGVDAADLGVSVETLAAVLHKHTRGEGVLEDLFADPRVSDAYASAPVGENPLRVTVDGERHGTNVRLTPTGAAALASRLRAVSGRGFSRATPTVDATVEAAGRRVRVAGVATPASDGYGFAFRRHDRDPWTIPDLVGNDTVTPGVAALLSLAVERGAAVLVAGPRGAGKTTVLGALLWELPAAVRTVAVEDTPELPIEALADAGRDVQALRTDPGEGPEPSPADALRTALRLGEGALVVGEVRGAEASVLYEAMRVGAGDAAVLGTIHGSGGEAVRERVVSDLGVPESAFAATDLVVTLASGPHRVARVEECRSTADGVAFETLWTGDSPGATADATATPDLPDGGPLARGNSRLLTALTDPGESYADLRRALSTRADALHRDAAAGRTAPGSTDDA
jgi:type IV secretory pathway ATPase VirB11/archaellum biosynthesis ATPase